MNRSNIILGCAFFLTSVGSLYFNSSMGQNPLIRNQFSADPTARVFGDSIYVYPSHDILATPGHVKMGWFCMQDYHVFSSSRLTDWKDEGVILTQQSAPWVDETSYSMWAPDCINRNGKYYFYFPSNVNAVNGKGFGIGVAIGDNPYGPFTPEKSPIKGVKGIDPNIFIDKDGQAYLYWAEGEIYMAKLKSNMLELASEPKVIPNLPEKGLKEGPFVFERKGIYYLTYPHVEDKTERLEYAVSNSPMGPFKVTGVIMDATADCWTNHQSIVKYKGQWYLFYHHNDYSPAFDKARSIRADSLFFNPDGTIQKVNATYRGIGISKADTKIQIDRYSTLGKMGAKIEFLDTTDTFKGWQLILSSPGAYVQYNTVDFGNNTLTRLSGRAWFKTDAAFEVRLDSVDGPLIAEVNRPKSMAWTEVETKLSIRLMGIHNLFIIQKGTGKVSLDWIRFK